MGLTARCQNLSDEALPKRRFQKVNQMREKWLLSGIIFNTWMTPYNELTYNNSIIVATS